MVLTIQGLLRASCSSREGSPTGEVAGDWGEAGFSALSPSLHNWTCFMSHTQVAVSCRAGFVLGSQPRDTLRVRAAHGKVQLQLVFGGGTPARARFCQHASGHTGTRDKLHPGWDCLNSYTSVSLPYREFLLYICWADFKAHQANPTSFFPLPYLQGMRTLPPESLGIGFPGSSNPLLASPALLTLPSEHCPDSIHPSIHPSIHTLMALRRTSA